MDLLRASPAHVRSMIRSGKLRRHPTKAMCEGYKQANLVLLPSSVSGHFKKFAQGNSGALPLLYTSEVGEVAAARLCSNSDIRTDTPLYSVVRNGKIEKQEECLLEYDWTKMVSFYVGCSFSFSKILKDNDIRPETNAQGQVSMYVTNLDCFESGPFKCKMVVSMLPIPEDKLSDVTTLTKDLCDVHGAPVHFGNAKSIGIDDIHKIDHGCETNLKEGDVPVFWCCGVTGLEAVKSANLDLAFTHAPGHMFITDIKQEDVTIGSRDAKDAAKVIKYCNKSGKYTSLSNATGKILELLDSNIQKDPGSRGMANLVVDGDFTKAALALSHARNIALITGFPVFDSAPHEETDGLPGIISLLSALQALDKNVTIIVDEENVDFNQSLFSKCCALLPKSVNICPFTSQLPVEDQLLDSSGQPLYEVVLASERVGRAVDGNYYSMKGKNLTERVSPIDDLFLLAQKHPDILTIGIGDGGNELGMGKVLQNVQDHIKNGKLIACVTPADLLIATGVSNWGCYALGLALFALRSCPIHERYLRKAIGYPVDAKAMMMERLPSVSRERKILEIVQEFGIKDGVAPNQKMSVDGMCFSNEHSAMIAELRSVVGL